MWLVEISWKIPGTVHKHCPMSSIRAEHVLDNIDISMLASYWPLLYAGYVGGWPDGWDADPGPDPGECQGESEDPEAGSQEVPQPHTLQGQYIKI